jgi:hypothetical protein
MAVLEALLLMAAQTTTPPPPPAREAAPPAELLEFLADWSEEDAKLIDADTTEAAKPVKPDPRRRRTLRDAGGKTP